jgi:hypothetical protein
VKIKSTRIDGSLDAEPDFFMISHELSHAQEIAEKHGQIVHFEWNGWPIAVAGDTDLSLIMRQWESRKSGDSIVEIGPYPDPATTPKFTHGTFVVEISR